MPKSCGDLRFTMKPLVIERGEVSVAHRVFTIKCVVGKKLHIKLHITLSLWTS